MSGTGLVARKELLKIMFEMLRKLNKSKAFKSLMFQKVLF